MMRKLIPVMLLVVLLAFGNAPARAAAESFNQNRVIEDVVFDNTKTMTAAQIDSFLNGFPNSCISPNSGFAAIDPTGYNPTSGYSYGGYVTAGQVIYDASQAYGINPQVLLSTLQKEQSLVAGGTNFCNNGDQNKYAAAVGYGCPDSGTTYSYTGLSLYRRNGTVVSATGITCVNSASKAGFSQQVIRAAWLLKFGEQRAEGNVSWAVIKGSWDNSDDPQTCYGGPMTQGTFARCPSGGAAYYDGYTTIDGTAVHMDNGSTAALYWYTPHFSGNQNFYNIFTNWFGSTSNPSLYFAVIQGPNSSALYLQTSAGKYYLPSGAIMKDWGLDSLTIKQVSQGYLDSLPTHDWVGHLLKDDWGNMFIVENGKLHYVRNASYLPLWGIDASSAVQSLGIAYTLPSDTWAGRFVRDASQPSGQMWILDNGTKHAVPDANMLYEWRYTPDQLTTVSTAYLDGITTGDPVTAFASDGSTTYMVDTGQKWTLPNTTVKDAFYGTQTPVSYSAATLSFLPDAGTATQFAINSQNGQWFMLEGGKRHYIPTGDMATLWGKTSRTALTPLSPGLISNLPDAGVLGYVVQAGSPATYWLIDGSRHRIPDATVTNAWLPQSATPPTYSADSVNALPQGADASTDINGAGSPYIYTLDGGIKHYLSTSVAHDAWGGSVMTVSPQLVNSVPEGAFVSDLVKDTSGNAYLLMSGTLYPIDSAFYDAWGVNAVTPVITNQALGRYTVSTSTLKAFVKAGGTSYVMSGGKAFLISKYNDAFVPASLGEVTLPRDYFASSAQASYLLTTADSRIWLMAQGKKILLTFEQAVSYGYLSRGVQPTSLSISTLNLIPNSTAPASLLIQAPGSGIKLLSFGTALGFPDGPTLENYVSTDNPILVVSPSVFDAFAVTRNTSRLLIDDRGNYFWMENGQKRYIVNWSVLTHYLSTPVTYLQGTTMYLLPSGSNLTQ